MVSRRPVSTPIRHYPAAQAPLFRTCNLAGFNHGENIPSLLKQHRKPENLKKMMIKGSALLPVQDEQKCLRIFPIVEKPEFHRIRSHHLTGCDTGFVIDHENLAIR